MKDFKITIEYKNKKVSKKYDRIEISTDEFMSMTLKMEEDLLRKIKN